MATTYSYPLIDMKERSRKVHICILSHQGSYDLIMDLSDARQLVVEVSDSIKRHETMPNIAIDETIADLLKNPVVK